MKIEVGKYYKTRKGEKVYITGTCPFNAYNEFVGIFEDTATILYRDNGMIFSDAKESKDDIIEEWEDPSYVSVTVYLCRNVMTKEQVIKTYIPCNCWEILGFENVKIKERDKV